MHRMRRAENDRKTDVYFTQLSDVPCNSLPSTMPESNRRNVPIVQQGRDNQSKGSTISSAVSTTPFQNTYR